MADNLKKKKLDAKRISKQSWEQAYQRRKRAKRKKALSTSFSTWPETPPEIKRVPPSSISLEVHLRGPLLISAFSRLESALRVEPKNSKRPFDFNNEWNEKGRPIFEMILLFCFGPRVNNTIARLMQGIDWLCKVPEEVVEE